MFLIFYLMNMLKKITSLSPRFLVVTAGLGIATSIFVPLSNIAVSAFTSPIIANNDEMTISSSYNGKLVMNLLDNDEYTKNGVTEKISYNALESGEYYIEYLGNHEAMTLEKGRAYIDTTKLSDGKNNLGDYNICKDEIATIP